MIIVLVVILEIVQIKSGVRIEDVQSIKDFLTALSAMKIGNDVWIGQNVTLLPGVHVGDGCIIGTNAVVGGDIPPYSVVVDNPAKIIRKRFDDEMIELLEKLQWWNLSEKQIQKIIPILSCGDINYVKEQIKKFLTQGEKI